MEEWNKGLVSLDLRVITPRRRGELKGLSLKKPKKEVVVVAVAEEVERQEEKDGGEGRCQVRRRG